MQNYIENQEHLSLFESSEALQNGNKSSLELCTNYIERHRKIDHDLRCFIDVNVEEILKEADLSDKRRKTGKSLSLFDGVPIGIKDNISIQGHPCGCASQILKNYVAPYDATVISKLKEKGFVFFGRANMDEFAMGSSTENSSYPNTRNPYDMNYVPGGSSGGSAAAVASGQVPASLGSDTGGSIRQPANYCGVVGLKPTYGRVSRYGLVAFASSLDQIGPITQDVRDAAILLDIIGGHDNKDATSLREECAGFQASLHSINLKGKKIGFPKSLLDGEGISEEIRNTVQDATKAFMEGGCELIEVSLPHLKYSVASYYIIATAEASSNLSRFDGIRYGTRHHDETNCSLLETYLKSRENGFGAEVKRRILLGTYVLSSGYYEAYYLKAQKMRALIREDYEKVFNCCDFLIYPVTPSSAFPIGSVKDPLEMYLSDSYTSPVNLAGNCAVSIPSGKNRKGLPLGFQLIAPSLGEKTILKAGHWYLEECKP